MNIHPQTADALDPEQQRQQFLQDLISEHGPNWSEHYSRGTFGCHELLDRTLIAAEAVERNILAHPACAQNPQWYALAHQAVTALQELYQRVGAEHVAEKPNGSGQS